MKTLLFCSISLLFIPGLISVNAQDKPVAPSKIITGVFHGETPPLRDLPVMTAADWQALEEDSRREEFNPELNERSYPFAASALPKGPDQVWQNSMGSNREIMAPVQNFNGQDSPYFPPDCNGTVGPNHYMQTINTVYAIYNKAGTLVAGPSNMNTLFTGVTGATCNDGDPIVLYDEQAQRWLAVEFSLCGSNDYMLIAVSTTNDPTGTWYKYSFDVADVPDYEKFGIWQDGYYMGTNNSSGNDIYVFERSQMLLGLTAQAVAFNNPWRPTTLDGFMCVPPLDNDGTFAPTGEPGLFITINDDAIAGGSDQLWIYELDVDWATPSNSTFTRSQQINVTAFDSNFGNNWDNIKQLGTTQEVDAIPQVIMNPPQYRNFATYETILCCHTVDVDNTDHAGIRWYELRRVSSGNWTIRQQGTYAPDGHSRWMGSIMLNVQNEIGLGYSVSSTTMYPAIRYCGQSATAYNSATGILDVAEQVIQNGVYFQSNYNRWGDYSALQVDPTNDVTFWFTSEYIGTGGTRKTKIASFNIGTVPLNADFAANNTTPELTTTVTLTDLSAGDPTTWSWSITPATFNYVGGTGAASQNPQVQFTAAGAYTVALTVTNSNGSNTETKTNYINAIDCSGFSIPFQEDFSDGALPACWSNVDHEGNGQVWQFNNPGSRTINTTTSANGFAILDSDHYGTGNSQDADLITPTLDLTDYVSVNLYFQHYFLEFSGSSATLSYSINGGSNWTVLQTWTTSTENAATYDQDLTTQLAGQANVKLKWNYTGNWGYYWAVDDINITGTGPNTWIGGSSSEWTLPANWSAGTVPTVNNPVIVPSSASNWPVFSGNLTIGATCGNVTIHSGGHISVSGNLTINAGSSLEFLGVGELSIGGSWTDNGSFTPGQGTVNFSGSTISSINKFLSTSDITTYTLSTFPKSMTSLAGTDSGLLGDNGNNVFPMGFTFNYAGTPYTQLRISTNGWISLNETGTTATANANLFNNTAPNTTVAPWFDNLMDDATSSVKYLTEGSFPFQVFTVEWYRILTYNNVSNSRISFQAKFYESSNIIEFHYGNLEPATFSNSEGASIGIEDATSGSGHFIEATTGSTTTGVTTLKANANWPAINYRFTPPLGTETFYNVEVSKTSSSAEFNVNTNVNGSFIVLPGASFNVKIGKTLNVQGTAMN